MRKLVRPSRGNHARRSVVIQMVPFRILVGYVLCLFALHQGCRQRADYSEVLSRRLADLREVRYANFDFITLYDF